jgi:hypothetical protein
LWGVKRRFPRKKIGTILGRFWVIDRPENLL